ncbi:beta-galactosidase [soil metagenome]
MTHLPVPAKFALGVCYYPEHWPRDRWEIYASQMRNLGLTYVRIGEFAWSRIEPSEGVFQWDWLDEAIDILAAEQLRVVLCTPTATPPAWLIRDHPEILPIDDLGRVREFGSRKHYDHASPVYREHSRRITRAVAERYGEHPAVDGWQTDNEFGCHSTTRSYGPASQVAFRSWLKNRYHTIDALNNAWGAVFWSQEYADWEQILPPNLTVTQPNPSHALDFYRFASDAVAEFQEEQVAILREVSPDRWITHNFMIFFSDFDHYKVAGCLDFVSWDSYPLGMVERSDLPETEKIRWARTGNPDLISLNHDLYRGLKPERSFWVMEQGVGQVNWAESNCLPAGGAASLWTAQAWAHGAAAVSVFRWRAATVAQEIMHSALLRHDETLDRGATELSTLEIAGRANSVPSNNVVLLHDYESLWITDEQPHSKNATYWNQFMLFYNALRSMGVDVDIRHPDSDLSAYALIVAPCLQIVDEARSNHLAAYADSAQLVFGPRAAFRTTSGRVHEDGQPGPLRSLLGCSMQNFDGMRPGLTEKVGDHIIHTWAENYALHSAESVHRYNTGPLAGTAAVVRLRNVTTIGAWSESLVTEILATDLAAIGTPHVNLPEGIRVAHSGPNEIWMNFNQAATKLPDGSTMSPVSFRIGAPATR